MMARKVAITFTRLKINPTKQTKFWKKNLISSALYYNNAWYGIKMCSNIITNVIGLSV